MRSRVSRTCPTYRKIILHTASTGQAPTLEKLVKYVDGNMKETVIAAATEGHLGCLQVVAEQFDDHEDDEHFLDYEDQNRMKYRLNLTAANGLSPAAANGYYDVFEFLWFATRDRECDPDDSMTEYFCQAVANGHFNIVKFIEGDIPTWFETFQQIYGAALAKAIADGYADVVGFLVTWEENPCDEESMFEEVIAVGKHGIARKICEVYKVHEGDDLFVNMDAWMR